MGFTLLPVTTAPRSCVAGARAKAVVKILLESKTYRYLEPLQALDTQRTWVCSDEGTLVSARLKLTGQTCVLFPFGTSENKG